MTRVLLVRHAQSTWNADGRWQGWANPPLSPLGEEQAAAAARHLPHVDAVCSSDLVRARRTAELLVAGRDIGDVEVYRGLRERGVGAFEGLTNDEIATRYPNLPRSGKSVLEIPGGEDAAAVVARTIATLSRLAEAHGDVAVLAVTHGGVIRNLERHAGVTTVPSLPNLGARWVEVDTRGTVTLGDRILLHRPDEAPVTVPEAL